MLRLFIAILFLQFPLPAAAEWFLEQSEDGHWITTRNNTGHQFILATESGELKYLLILDVPEREARLPDSVQINIDSDEGVVTPLRLVKQRPGKAAFQVEFEEGDKKTYLHRMVAGLKLKLHFYDHKNRRESLVFSLLGFTDVYHDWLIANQLGRLDPFWLHSHGKDRELNCYYTAQFTIKALEGRRKGKTESETLGSLAHIGIVSVDEMLPDIVAGVYALPDDKLPDLPVSRKYQLFQSCLQKIRP